MDSLDMFPPKSRGSEAVCLRKNGCAFLLINPVGNDFAVYLVIILWYR
jgi:hypothetical protein